MTCSRSRRYRLCRRARSLQTAAPWLTKENAASSIPRSAPLTHTRPLSSDDAGVCPSCVGESSAYRMPTRCSTAYRDAAHTFRAAGSPRLAAGRAGGRPRQRRRERQSNERAQGQHPNCIPRGFAVCERARCDQISHGTCSASGTGSGSECSQRQPR